MLKGDCTYRGLLQHCLAAPVRQGTNPVVSCVQVETRVITCCLFLDVARSLLTLFYVLPSAVNTITICSWRSGAAHHAMVGSRCSCSLLMACSRRLQSQRRMLGQPQAAALWLPTHPKSNPGSNASRSAPAAAHQPWGVWGPAARRLVAERVRAGAGAAELARRGRLPQGALWSAGSDAPADVVGEPAVRVGGLVQVKTRVGLSTL